MKEIYSLYKTTNLVNGKIYIGVHDEKKYPKMDSYLGSGNLIKQSLKKYGRDNFKREILVIADSLDYVMELERRYVTSEFIKLKSNYNLVIGGKGKKMNSRKQRQPHTDEAKKKMSVAAKKRKHKPHSEETKKKIGDANRGNTGWEHTDEAKEKISQSGRERGSPSYEARRKSSETQKGRKFSEEHKKKLSEAAKRRHARNRKK